MERWKRARTSLYSIRMKSGLTQLELAKRAGVNHTTIVHAETGKKQPQLATLLKIVGVLDEELSKQGTRVTLDNFPDILVNNSDDPSKYPGKVKSLNNGLYLLRTKSGMTKEELAARVGVTTVIVRNAETGRVLPSIAILLKLVRVLNDELSNQVSLATRNANSTNDYSLEQLNTSQFQDSSTTQRLRISLLQGYGSEALNLRKDSLSQ
ncbi:MAG: helix-turn-helix protein [Chloroflexi bacterium]|jgi:DNA-binding XRE family transcriptional regulator|nr:helix-turn-helix protein [Chloroflexota bacterium]